MLGCGRPQTRKNGRESSRLPAASGGWRLRKTTNPNLINEETSLCGSDTSVDPNCCKARATRRNRDRPIAGFGRTVYHRARAERFAGAVGCPHRAVPAAGRLVGAGRAPAVARRRCRMRRERAGCRGRRTVCGERRRCVRKSAGSSSPDGRTGSSRSGFGCRDNRRSGLRQLDPDGGGIRCERAIPPVLTRNTPAPRLGRGAGGVPCVERQLWCGGLPRRGGRPDFPENGSDTGLVGASRTASRPSAPEARYRNMPV